MWQESQNEANLPFVRPPVNPHSGVIRRASRLRVWIAMPLPYNHFAEPRSLRGTGAKDW